MIWLIIFFVWALAMVLFWKLTKYGLIFAAIALIVSVGVYYYIGRPNLPDHPHKEVVGLFSSKKGNISKG